MEARLASAHSTHRLTQTHTHTHTQRRLRYAAVTSNL